MVNLTYFVLFKQNICTNQIHLNTSLYILCAVHVVIFRIVFKLLVPLQLFCQALLYSPAETRLRVCRRLEIIRRLCELAV